MKNVWQQLNDNAEWTSVQHGRVRERLLRHMRAVPEAPARGFQFFAFPQFSPALMVILLAVIGVGSVGTAAFAKASNPYDTLYPVRVLTEKIRTHIAGSPEARAKLALKFSENRLNELRVLAEAQAGAEGRGKVGIAIAADRRLDAFKRNGHALWEFSDIAEKQIEQLRAAGDDTRAEALGGELDAVLDASLGILFSVEVGAPAEEPIRAVVAKTKQDISPLESKVEMALNKADAVFLEKAVVAASITRTEAEAKARRKVAAVRGAVEEAARALKDKQDAYGSDVFEGMEKALLRAHDKISEADRLLTAGDFQGAYRVAVDALRIATHLKVYAPVAGSRSKVQVMEDNQLRLHILPSYKEDFKAKVKEEKKEGKREEKREEKSIVPLPLKRGL